MSVEGATPAVEAFLKNFFAPPNSIGLSEINAHGLASHLVPWIAPLLGESPQATVLPCRRGKEVHWYGLAFTDDQLSILGEDLLAVVGPTYSTFRGHRATLDPGDPIESAVQELTEGLAFRFTAGEKGKIWERLELLRALDTRRPASPREVPRPPGRVLRDFYMSVLAKNLAGAERHLAYLTKHRYLTPSNLLFLRVQALAAVERWEELLALPELPDLLQMRRPVAVTEALLTAVYQQELVHFEESADADAAVTHFRAAVLPQYGSLLARRAGLHTTAALKMLMLLAVGGASPDPALRDAVWNARGGLGGDRSYLKLLADRLPTSLEAPSPADPLGEAVAAERRGDYDRAFALANAAPATVARARLLILVAYELQTLEAERSALDAVGALDATSRAECLRGRLLMEAYEALTGPGQARAETSEPASAVEAAVTSFIVPPPAWPKVPTNWLEWLSWITEDVAVARAVDVARQGAQQWSLEDLIATPGTLEAFTAQVDRHSGTPVFQYALPHLVTFFQRDPAWPRPELRPVYQVLLLALALQTQGAEDDVAVAVGLASALLSLGLNPEAYEDVAESIRHVLTASPSATGVMHGLEMIDSMIESPCPEEGLRAMLVSDVLGLIQKYWRRVDPAQRDLFALLCQDLRQPEMAAALRIHSPESAGDGDQDASVLASLNGRSIAVYSLTERAARHLQRIVMVQAPGATVYLTHDLVGSAHLRQLARGADIFIMTTASATHAATGFIQANRDPDRPLLRPGGKGVGSMLRSLISYLETEGVTIQ